MNMNIKLNRVRIENFRSIKKADICLNLFSVLFGMNDSGKSNFLLALSYALSNRTFTEKDVFRSKDTDDIYKTSVIIDLEFIPIGKNGNQEKNFVKLWKDHLGDRVGVDNEDNQYFCLRTKFFYDADREEYVRERFSLGTLNNPSERAIGGALLSVFDFFYIDANRDIALDIRDKMSVWNKQVSKIKIDEKSKLMIETSLRKVSEEIIENSSFLKQASEDLKYATNSLDSEINIHPITQTIEDVYKGLDIFVIQQGSTSIQIANMGSGTRSRAVFSSIKTVVNEKQEHNNSIELPYFCLISFEEIESHIHPQSQRKLLENFLRTDAQKIITTHSPYILSLSNIDNLIYVCSQNAETFFSPIVTLKLTDGEKSYIKEKMISTNSEILFASIVILVEGATERLAFPIFFKEYFDFDSFEKGVSIIDVGGYDRFETFIKILKEIGIKWFIFCDNDDDNVKDDIKKQIESVGLKSSEIENVIFLPFESNYEKYLIDSGYVNEIISAISDYHEGTPFKSLILKSKFEFSKFTCELCKKLIFDKETKKFCCNDGRKRTVLEYMKKNKNKTKYAQIIAEHICKNDTGKSKIPPMIKTLFEKLNESCKIKIIE